MRRRTGLLLLAGVLVLVLAWVSGAGQRAQYFLERNGVGALWEKLQEDGVRDTAWALYDKLLRNAILLCDTSLADEDSTAGDVYVDGTSNMLAKPDFADAARMRELFRTFEEKSRLVKILNECVAKDQLFPGGVQVVIGREHATPSMRNCTLITAPYRIGEGETTGTLGVVGPMRIEYARMMAVVNYMARLIERTLSQDTASH